MTSLLFWEQNGKIKQQTQTHPVFAFRRTRHLQLPMPFQPQVQVAPDRLSVFVFNVLYRSVARQFFGRIRREIADDNVNFAPQGGLVAKNEVEGVDQRGNIRAAVVIVQRVRRGFRRVDGLPIHAKKVFFVKKQQFTREAEAFIDWFWLSGPPILQVEKAVVVHGKRVVGDFERQRIADGEQPAALQKLPESQIVQNLARAGAHTGWQGFEPVARLGAGVRFGYKIPLQVIDEYEAAVGAPEGEYGAGFKNSATLQWFARMLESDHAFHGDHLVFPGTGKGIGAYAGSRCTGQADG